VPAGAADAQEMITDLPNGFPGPGALGLIDDSSTDRDIGKRISCSARGMPGRHAYLLGAVGDPRDQLVSVLVVEEQAGAIGRRHGRSPEPAIA
jgi:hypothetical protein